VSEKPAEVFLPEPSCPGSFDVQGLGDVHLVPTGWGMEERVAAPRVSSNMVEPTMGSRAYWSSSCSAGTYDQSQYLSLDFRGKTLSYTTDMSGAGCGCNAALYLASMGQSEGPGQCGGDYYCDANNVCGQSCAEIDIQESNLYAWHSTLHSAWDHSGYGKGYGGGGTLWNGFRNWEGEDFGPGGRCINTREPFNVAVSFPVHENTGRLSSMDIKLTQPGRPCGLDLSLNAYSDIAKMDEALAAGMTPIMSYWSSDEMLWMDGAGQDGKGACTEDLPKLCGEAVRFYNFSFTPAFAAGAIEKAFAGAKTEEEEKPSVTESESLEEEEPPVTESESPEEEEPPAAKSESHSRSRLRSNYSVTTYLEGRGNGVHSGINGLGLLPKHLFPIGAGLVMMMVLPLCLLGATSAWRSLGYGGVAVVTPKAAAGVAVVTPKAVIASQGLTPSCRTTSSAGLLDDLEL